jgi:hypothetical protein
MHGISLLVRSVRRGSKEMGALHTDAEMASFLNRGMNCETGSHTKPRCDLPSRDRRLPVATSSRPPISAA